MKAIQEKEQANNGERGERERENELMTLLEAPVSKWPHQTTSFELLSHVMLNSSVGLSESSFVMSCKFYLKHMGWVLED